MATALILTREDRERVDAAIKAHGQWRAKLLEAVQSGRSPLPVSVACAADQCEFGQWLQSAFPAALRPTAAFEELRQAHARFHQVAGNVLKLALSGHAEEAVAQLGAGREFMTLSGTLLVKLQALRGQ